MHCSNRGPFITPKLTECGRAENKNRRSIWGSRNQRQFPSTRWRIWGRGRQSQSRNGLQGQPETSVIAIGCRICNSLMEISFTLLQTYGSGAPSSELMLFVLADRIGEKKVPFALGKHPKAHPVCTGNARPRVTARLRGSLRHEPFC